VEPPTFKVTQLSGVTKHGELGNHSTFHGALFREIIEASFVESSSHGADSSIIFRGCDIYLGKKIYFTNLNLAATCG
jgi:hypothetical protein